MAARLVLGVAWFLSAAATHGAVTGDVQTIGGSYRKGFVDGDNFTSLFNDPRGLAADNAGKLYVADYGNNAVRAITVGTEETSTFARVNLQGPIALAFDTGGNLLVANQLGRNIVKFDRNGNYLNEFATVNADPTALAVDAAGNVYVTFLTNRLVRFTATGVSNAVYVVGRPNAQLWGVTVVRNESLVVSDGANQVLWRFPLAGGAATIYAGTEGSAGFQDGGPGVAQFSAPRGIATTTNGVVVLADFFNHRVRGISADGIVSTLYGVDPSTWSNTPAQYLPGWTDGAAATAELKLPFGVAVDANNTIYNSETSGYAVIRKVTGTTLPTNSVVAALTAVLLPNSGFYANGVTVFVTSLEDPSGGFPAGTKIYYTLDGSVPGPENPASQLAPIIDGSGRISLQGPVNLSSLSVRVINGAVTGPVVRGGATVVGRPVFSPNAGIFPNGVNLVVTNASTVSGLFEFGTKIFYTTNTTEPTVLSLQGIVTDGIGFINIFGPVDLANVRVKAFIGLAGSETTSGVATGFDKPAFSPNTGYYPGGVYVVVTNEASPSGVFSAETRIRYTTDGTEPTTTSPLAPLTVTGISTILWRSSTLDLTSLKVKAFGLTNSSVSVNGLPFVSDSFDGEVGIASSRTNIVVTETSGGLPVTKTNGLYFGGPGARVVIPIIANMAPATPLRSVSFIVELTSPTDATDTKQRIEPPSLPRVELMSTNDFIPLTVATTNAPVDIAAVTTYTTNAFGTNISVNRLPIAYLTTNGFTVDRFATVGIVSIPIPLTAKIGSRYTVRIKNLTGRGDFGLLRLRTNFNATIQIKSIPYLVGDTSPHLWYNAGDFGDRYASADVEVADKPLDNADVSDAFFSSLRTFIKPPYTSSDLFDAMDSAPEDTPGVVGGDQKVGFLDWNITLLRSLGLNQNNWRRYKTNDAPRNVAVSQGELFGLGLEVADGIISMGQPWDRAATLEAGVVQGVTQGGTASVPIYVRTRAGKTVGALQFAVVVEADAGDPAVNGVTFVPAAGIPAPDLAGDTFSNGRVQNAFYAAWTLNRLNVGGRVLLGYAQFRIPNGGFTGHAYTVRFSGQEGVSLRGATGQYEAYDFDSVRAKVWVNSIAAEPANVFSDEWKIYFFGTLKEEAGFADEDSDNDGFGNFAEFKGGLNPLQSDWRVRVEGSQVHVRWFAATGKRYTLERGVNLNSWGSGVVEVNGDDTVHEFTEPVSGANTQFYRIRSAP